MKRVDVEVKVKLIGWLMIVGVGLMRGQDEHMSRWWEMPMMVDYSGVGRFLGNERVVVGYRSQWGSVMSKGYRTMVMMGDMVWGRGGENGYGGVGLMVMRDEAGVEWFRRLEVSGGLSYHVRIGEESYLSGGIGGGVKEMGVDVDKLLFDMQYDGNGFNGSLPSGEDLERSRVWMGDVGCGVSFRMGGEESMMVAENLSEGGKMMEVGIGMFHVVLPRYSFLKEGVDKVGLRWVLHGMGLVGIRGTNAGLMPGLLVQYQGGAMELVMVGRMRYILNEESKFADFSRGAAVNVGVGYRGGESVIPMFELEAGSFGLGVSYDVVVSGLSRKGKPTGSFEFTLRYINPNPFKRQERFFN